MCRSMVLEILENKKEKALMEPSLDHMRIWSKLLVLKLSKIIEFPQ